VGQVTLVDNLDHGWLCGRRPDGSVGCAGNAHFSSGKSKKKGEKII
jgi:hypothetical protein